MSELDYVLTEIDGVFLGLELSFGNMKEISPKIWKRREKVGQERDGTHLGLPDRMIERTLS